MRSHVLVRGIAISVNRDLWSLESACTVARATRIPVGRDEVSHLWNFFSLDRRIKCFKAGRIKCVLMKLRCTLHLVSWSRWQTLAKRCDRSITAMRFHVCLHKRVGNPEFLRLNGAVVRLVVGSDWYRWIKLCQLRGWTNKRAVLDLSSHLLRLSCNDFNEYIHDATDAALHQMHHWQHFAG